MGENTIQQTGVLKKDQSKKNKGRRREREKGPHKSTALKRERKMVTNKWKCKRPSSLPHPGE